MKHFLIYSLSILLSSCSLFQRGADWSQYKNDVNYHFTKVREATLSRVLIDLSYYKETRTYLRYIREEISQFRHQWTIIPREWGEQLTLKIQQASLDQDVSKSTQSLAGEKFIADVNRALLKYIEQLRSLSGPSKTAEEKPRSLFFF